MSNTNYDGRTLDLCILGALPYSAQTTAEVDSTLDIARGGQICAGVVKLMQKVMILLLTYSQRYDPFWGTDVPEALLSGNLNKAATRLGQTLPTAMSEVVASLKAQEYLEMPLDERIDRLEQVDEMTVDYLTGSISIKIRVTTLLGAQIELVVPIRKLV